MNSPRYALLGAVGAVCACVAAFGCGSNSDDSPGAGGANLGGATPTSGGLTSTTGGASSGGTAPAAGGLTSVNGGAPSTQGGATGSSKGGASGVGGSSSTAGATGQGGANSGTGGGMSLGGSASGGANTGKGGSSSGGASSGTGGGTSTSAKFSFFVTSMDSLLKLAKAFNKSEIGFGGDLRYGETGDGAGLRGADKICAEIAEIGLPGSKNKGWRAFLSTTAGPVHAKDRIGSGPWYDRNGKLVAMNLEGLLQTRHQGGESTPNDLPNEFGIPNHKAGAEGCTNDCPDNHDTLTGSTAKGELYTSGTNPTCADWTSAEANGGKPRVGHSWPRGNQSQSWIAAHDTGGCAPGINLSEMGATNGQPTVGSGGGYGGIYCFAMTP